MTTFSYLRRFRFLAVAMPMSLVLSLATIDGSAQEAEKKRKTIQRKTDAFKLQIHIPSDEIAQQTIDVAEKTWAVAADLYGVSSPPKKLLTTSLYRDTAGYEQVDEKLTGGKFKRNLAFAHHDSLSAHVALQPYLTNEGLEDVGLPKLTARLLAHEMAHLVRFHHLSHSFRDHPEWIVHGMASYIDKKVVMELGYVSDPNQNPDSGQNIYDVKQLVKKGSLPSVASLLKDETLDLKFYELYSVQWIFLDMLMTKHEKRFRLFLHDLRRLGGGRDFAKRASDLLIKTLEVGTEELESDFLFHIAHTEAEWIDYVRSLETGGEVWHQIAFPNSGAIAWKQTPLPESVSISTEATFLRGATQQLNLRIGMPTRFTQYSLTAGYGLNVFEFDEGKWNTTEKKEIAGLAVGQPLKIEFAGSKGDFVELKLNGNVIYSGKLKRAKTDQLGLAVQAGSVIAWKNLRVIGVEK
ncbi:MAG: hypothetical protein AB8B55_10810 [Mariniblastus sp.]